VIDWLESHPAISTGVFVGSIVLLVGSLWVGRRFLITIPPDYFTRRHKPLERWRDSHPALRWSLLIGKNALGAVLIFLGLVMFLTPGQGILTLLLGIALVDVPGKQWLERRIIARPTVLRLVNRMRAKAGRPPLEIDHGSAAKK
jgi:hypothetical protein